MACFATPYGLRCAGYCSTRAHAQQSCQPLIRAGGNQGVRSACIFTFTDFTVGTSTFPLMFLCLCWITMCGLVARRYRMARTALLLEAFAVPAIIGGMGLLSIIAIAAVSGPFVDRTLVQIDALMGFDWLVLYHFHAGHPWLMEASRLVYWSFSYQIVLVPLMLWLWRRDEMMWRYIAAFALALIPTILIFPFVPAEGAYNYFNIPLEGLDNAQWKFKPYIEGLRNGTIRDMTRASAGLIAVPSFHAAAGILFLWATAGIRILRWPMIALNIAMIFTALVIGAHYLTDIIAGIAVAIIAIWLAPILMGTARRAPDGEVTMEPVTA